MPVSDVAVVSKPGTTSAAVMPQSVPPERDGGLFGGGRLLGGGRRLLGGGRRLLGGGRRLLAGGRRLFTGGRCVVGGREESGFLPLSGISLD